MSGASASEPDRDDGIPRRTFWASFPRRSLARVVLLLAMLAAILYLRERTSSIATCMAEAFHAPPSAGPGVRVRWPAVPAPDGGRRSP